MICLSKACCSKKKKKACCSAVDTPLFPTGIGLLAVLPAKQKSPGQISGAICYSLKDQVLQGKLGMTTEK